MAPIGVFSSWLTLATKSRRVASTRRALVWSSASTRTRSVRQRGDPDVEQQVGVAQVPRSSAHLDLLGQQPLVPAGLAGQLEHPGIATRLPRVRPSFSACGGGLEHLVVRADHDAGGPDHPQHLADAVGHDDLAHLRDGEPVDVLAAAGTSAAMPSPRPTPMSRPSPPSSAPTQFTLGS